MKEKFAGYKVAAACFIILFMHNGALNTVGVFLAPIAEGNNFSVGDTGIMITFATGASAIVGLFFAQSIIKRLSPKWALFIGSFLCAGHFLIYSFSTKLWQYYLAAAIGGIVICIATVASTSAIISEWFIDKRATVLGVVLGGSAIGGALWQAVSGALTEAYNFRIAYRVLAVALLIIPTVTNVLFIRMPDDLGQKALGADKTVKSSDSEQSSIAADGVTLKEALKTTSFYILFVGILCGALAVTGFNQYLAACLSSFGMDVSTASNYTSFLTLLCAFAVMMLGSVAQKVGDRVYMIILFAGGIIGALIIAVFSSSISTPMLIVAILCGALMFPITSSLVPTVCGGAFGDKDYAGIVIYLMSGNYIGSAICPVLYKFLLAAGWAVSDCYYITVVLGVIALALCLFGLKISPLQKIAKNN